MKTVLKLSLAVLFLAPSSCAPNRPATQAGHPYPASWWTPVRDPHPPSWEILPQAAAPGEVILSKRNELGLLSNFAATPLVFHGKKFASVEGFWQATKYPENEKDPRMHYPGIHWPYTRAQVESMTAFEAKHAGDVGTTNMKTMGIDWVSFEGRHMVYRAPGESDFYKLIVQVMKEKLKQNPQVRDVLLRTGDLRLRPDHQPGPPSLKAWQYFDIWMSIRAEISKAP